MKMGTPTDEPGLYETRDGFAVQAKAKSGSMTTWKRKLLPRATRAEAMVWLEKLRAEALDTATAKNNDENPAKTLSVFARRWEEDLRRRVDEGDITPSTKKSHTWNLDKFILPFLGTMDLDLVKPKTIVEWMRWIPSLRMGDTRLGRGKKTYKQEPRAYARATLISAWRTLRAFMRWVTIDADLARNPAGEVRWSMKGAPPAKVKATMTQTEVGKLLDAAQAEEDRGVRMLIIVALVGALRASELSALEWGAFDLSAGTIEVRRSHVKGSIGPPKTQGSRRTLMLPADLVDELRAYQAWQLARDEERRARCAAKGKSDWVKSSTLLFPSATGTLMQPGSINQMLERCAERAGLVKHITSHAMRRTTNNLLRKTAGELVARKVTGHVTQQMTEHYSEVDHDERVMALHNAFGGALNGRTNSSSSPSGATENA